jgi:hypothetical protein
MHINQNPKLRFYDYMSTVKSCNTEELVGAIPQSVNNIQAVVFE